MKWMKGSLFFDFRRFYMFEIKSKSLKAAKYLKEKHSYHFQQTGKANKKNKAMDSFWGRKLCLVQLKYDSYKVSDWSYTTWKSTRHKIFTSFTIHKVFCSSEEKSIGGCVLFFNFVRIRIIGMPSLTWLF